MFAQSSSSKLLLLEIKQFSAGGSDDEFESKFIFLQSPLTPEGDPGISCLQTLAHHIDLALAVRPLYQDKCSTTGATERDRKGRDRH